MFRYVYINIFTMTLLSISLSSCGEKLIDTRVAAQLESQTVLLCDYSIYGEECSHIDKFILVKKDELKSEHIKEGVSIGGVSGSVEAGDGGYSECSSDNEVGCITTDKYKSLDIEPYLDNILSSSFILGKKGRIEVCNSSEEKFSDCYIADNSFKAIGNELLDSSNIKLGISLGGIEGEFGGAYSGCNEDGQIGCITTNRFKGININNYRDKFISSSSILGVEGSFVLPSVSSVLPTQKYGVNSNITGTLNYCDENGSGCYLKLYSEGVSGKQLKALNYDDIYSKSSYIKNGFTLVSGVTGTQPVCSTGESSCYIEGNDLKTAESTKLLASNIKHDISIGEVTGDYRGDYLSCTEESHTSCIADEYYPSVPATFSTSLLSSASINGVEGAIEDCEVSGNSCYINGDTLTAVESNKLLASNIHHGISLGGVSGEYNGDHDECNEDGSVGCIATSQYKATDINNHRGKIISTQSIFDIAGTFILPPTDSILPGEYGANGNLVGTISSCTGNDSGCYLQSYSGDPGYQLQALDYDDLYLKRSYIKNGYTLIPGIIGEQSVCDAADYNCYIDSNELKAAEYSKLIASNIKHDFTIAGVTGSYSGEYSSCSSDLSNECIATNQYKAIDINNHKSKIISSASIGDIAGTYVIPSSSLILSSASYGPSRSLSGNVPECSANGSGCYIKTYSGDPGYQLQALDFDALYSQSDYIQNGYSLVYGVEGTQTMCSAGGNNCYIDSNYKAVETSNLIASYIKHDLSLGGVTGNYNGDHAVCSAESHTSCIADSSYPSIPASYTSSLLSSESINGVYGDIDDCDVGDSSCYISSNTLKAAETSKLLSTNIKHDVSLGGVTGVYTGSYFNCSGSNHTSCIADEYYPSVPASLTSSLLSSESINGTPGDIDDCSAGDSSCYISSLSLKAAESSLLLSSNIKLGVSIGGVSGGYPSLMSPLEKAIATTDLTSTNFNSLMVSADRFEWFDANGTRYLGYGSSDLIATNVKKDIDIFGVVGTYETEEEEEEEEEEVDDHKFATNEHGFAMVNNDGTVSYEGYDKILDFTNIDKVVSNDKAFAALKKDGTVMTWGESNYGGNSYSVRDSLIDVVDIFSANDSYQGSFAALKSDGSVVLWGADIYDYSRTVSSTVTDVFTNKSNSYAFLKSDGSVVTKGNYSYGGNSSSVSSSLTSGVDTIYSTDYAFAALKTDKTVVSWGGYLGNYDSIKSSLTYVDKIYSNKYAFAALKTDKTLVVWGYPSNGGKPDYSNGNVVGASGTLTDIVEVYSNDYAFVARKTDGTVVVWGDRRYGGDPTYSNTNVVVATGTLDHIEKVYSNKYAFVAVKTDKTVVTWGDRRYGGNPSFYNSSVAAASGTLDNVEKVYSNVYSFAAFKTGGEIVTWGDKRYGGNSSSVSSSLTSGVTEVYSNNSGFAVFKSNNSSVVSWGNFSNYASISSSLVNVAQVVVNKGGAFAVRKSDGSVVTWGDTSYGGNSDEVTTSLSSGVIDLVSSYGVFVAVKDDDAIMWGNASYGITNRWISFDSIRSSLVNVTKVYSSSKAFAALKEDGTVVTWGHKGYGGDPNVSGTIGSISVVSASSPLVDVVDIFPGRNAFVALTSHKSVITWGDSNYGGNSSSVSGSLSSGIEKVLGFNYTFIAINEDKDAFVWGSCPYNGEDPLEDIETVFSDIYDVFVAVKENGDAIVWGNANSGGDPTYSEGSYVEANGSLTDLKKVVFNHNAVLLLKNDKTVVTWGDKYYGGDPTFSDEETTKANGSLTNIKDVYSNGYAFAALTYDGEVITWGKSSEGGDSTYPASGGSLDNVKKVYPIKKGGYYGCFAARNKDGTADVWGNSSCLENYSSQSNVVDIYAGSFAFVLIKGNNEQAVTWGDSNYGGDSSDVSSDLNGVIKVISTDDIYSGMSFAALTSAHTVASWGALGGGGNAVTGNIIAYTGSDSLTDIVKIYASDNYFVALRENGTYVAWGDDFSSSGI